MVLFHKFCINENGKYNNPDQYPDRILSTISHTDSISRRIWENETVYWRLESHSTTVQDRKLEEKIIKNAALTIGLLIPNRIRSTKGDADMIINFKDSTEEKFFKDRPGVLAFAYGPSSGIGGDITFNNDRFWWYNGDGVDAETYTKITGRTVENQDNVFKTYDMQHTMTHEMLHAMGVPHIENCQTCIMYPYYNGERTPQNGDINYLQSLYGEANINHRIMEMLLKRLGLGVNK